MIKKKQIRYLECELKEVKDDQMHLHQAMYVIAGLLGTSYSRYDDSGFREPHLCIQQQLDAICDHLKIDVGVTEPVGKKVIVKKRIYHKKKKSPSK